MATGGAMMGTSDNDTSVLSSGDVSGYPPDTERLSGVAPNSPFTYTLRCTVYQLGITMKILSLALMSLPRSQGPILY